MKILILILLCVTLSGVMMAQKPFSVFGHVQNLPELKTRGILDNTNTLWALDAVVSGVEVTFNNVDTYFETKVLSGVGAAVGIKKFKVNADSTVTTTFGASLALLTSVKLNEIVDTKLKVALLAHVYNFTAGPTFTLGDNKFGLLVGATINF